MSIIFAVSDKINTSETEFHSKVTNTVDQIITGYLARLGASHLMSRELCLQRGDEFFTIDMTVGECNIANGDHLFLTGF